MQGFQTHDIQIRKVKAAVTAGTTTQTATVDTQGFDGVVFLASIGTAAANNSLKAGGGAASNGSDASDYAGTSTIDAGAVATEFVLDVQRPNDRYVTASVLRGTSTTLESIWAILYKARALPVTNGTTAQIVKRVLSPALGTA